MERLDSIIGTISNELLIFVKFNDDKQDFIYFDSYYCEHLIEGSNILWSELDLYHDFNSETYVLPNYKML